MILDSIEKGGLSTNDALRLVFLVLIIAARLERSNEIRLVNAVPVHNPFGNSVIDRRWSITIVTGFLLA
jgi:hypothetical protein